MRPMMAWRPLTKSLQNIEKKWGKLGASGIAEAGCTLSLRDVNILAPRKETNANSNNKIAHQVIP